MQELEHIIEGVEIIERVGPAQQEISSLQSDSRKVETGSLFVAICGIQVDGHKFIDKAIENGATAVVAEDLPEAPQSGITYLKVTDTRAALGQIASRFFDFPSHRLKLVGVTGTNGKTTTTTLLYRLFQALGYKTGLISTIENRVGGKVHPATHTTPDVIALNALLHEMVDSGCDYAFMEVSSHALDQQRVAGIQYAGGVFTNISHDHLDYHGTFKNYIFAKKKLFDMLPAGAFALVNKDDRRGEVMLQNTVAGKHTFALKSMADFRARILENGLQGLTLEIENREMSSRLIGEFNAYNLLTAYAVAVLLEQRPLEVLQALSELPAAEGRFEQVPGPRAGIMGIVDYAHTPDALEKVLDTIDQLNQGARQIITVVGCGGDRDREKRPKMARIAGTFSDQVIITSDNPRSEDPQIIIADMLDGVPPYAMKKVLVIADREQAIKAGTRLAQEGGIVLVAGKGHEKYQEIKGERRPFDDKEVLRKSFSEL